MTDVVANFRSYVFKMLEMQALEGMKAILMDEETTKAVALTCSQTDIIMKDVVLVGKISRPYPQEEKELKSTSHLKAVCILRPTKQSVDTLCTHLKKPQFGSYYIFFTNIVSQDLLKSLAEADAQNEVIRQVHEYFADYYAITEKLFVANRPSTVPLYHNRSYWRLVDKSTWSRNVDTVLSLILSQKTLPTIRYTNSSDLTKQFTQDLFKRIGENDGLFQFPNQADDSLLLILDRRDDPVTPLLQNWTYQSMIHEQLNIVDNRVDMRTVPNIRPELNEIVLSSHQDPFFKKSMALNFGELGIAVKDLVSEYQAKVQNTTKVDSIEDMQNFVDKYPEFRQMSGNVSKHVAILSELSRLSTLYKLMEASELEQDIACANNNHNNALEGITMMLDNPKVRFDNKLNIVMLYALRYETERNNNTAQFKEKLNYIAPDAAAKGRIRAIDEVLRVAGTNVRGGDLFNNKTVWTKTMSFLSSGLKGVENMFTRHKPLLSETLDQLSKGKLKTKDYPVLNPPANDKPNSTLPKPTNVYVYILGGVTFEEAAAINEINTNKKDYPNFNVILGGSCVHNSKSYISDLLQEEVVGTASADHVTINVGRV